MACILARTRWLWQHGGSSLHRRSPVLQDSGLRARTACRQIWWTVCLQSLQEASSMQARNTTTCAIRGGAHVGIPPFPPRPGTENARSARQTSSSREIAMSLPTSQSLLRSDCELRVKQHAKNQSLRTPPMCHLWQPLCSRHPAEGNLDAHPRNHGVLGEVQRGDPSHHKSAAIHTC